MNKSTMGNKIGVLIAQGLDVPNFVKNVTKFVNEIPNFIKNIPRMPKSVPR